MDLILSYQLSCLVQECYRGTDRNLPPRHNVLILRETAVISYMHYHTDMMTYDMAFDEAVNGTGCSQSAKRR